MRHSEQRAPGGWLACFSGHCERHGLVGREKGRHQQNDFAHHEENADRVSMKVGGRMRKRSLDRNRNRGDEHDGKTNAMYAMHLRKMLRLVMVWLVPAMRTGRERAEWIEGSAPGGGTIRAGVITSEVCSGAGAMQHAPTEWHRAQKKQCDSPPKIETCDLPSFGEQIAVPVVAAWTMLPEAVRRHQTGCNCSRQPKPIAADCEAFPSRRAGRRYEWTRWSCFR